MKSLFITLSSVVASVAVMVVTYREFHQVRQLQKIRVTKRNEPPYS